MLERIVAGIIGFGGLGAVTWFLVAGHASEADTPSSRRDRLLLDMTSLDWLMRALGWYVWVGLFGAFASYSVTGRGIF